MSNSLPHAQKLFERFQGDERVRIVAVATAFEKDHYPWMADEAKIRGALEQNKWTFPVMRDKDEKTVRIVGLSGSYGTPMTLVLDPGGVVRWHNFNARADTAKQVEATVETLLESFYVAPIEGLDDRLKDYAKERYGDAWRKAEALRDDEAADAALKEQARQVCDNLEAAVARLVEQSAAKRAAGYPAAAQDRLETAVKLFRGVPKADEAAAALKEMKADAAFRAEIAAEKDLEKALALAAKGKPVEKRLESLARKYADTPVAARIAAARGG